MADLLINERPPGSRDSFSYYGKVIVVPVPGDIIRVMYSSFSTYYILVTEVLTGTGKDHPLIRGIILDQKGLSEGAYAPSSIVSRDAFEIRNGKRVNVKPKDRARILDYLVTEY